MTRPNPRLVITKPVLPDGFAAQKNAYQQILELHKSLEVQFLPILRLTPLEESNLELRQFIENKRKCLIKIVVFVSPSALEFGVACLGKWPTGVVCALMGAQSAELGKQLGVPSDAILAPRFSDETVPEDSTGLFKLILEKYAPGAVELLICKGPVGQRFLFDSLRLHNFSVSELETYNRQPEPLQRVELEPLMQLGSSAVLWVTSTEAIKVLDKALEGCNSVQARRFRGEASVICTHARMQAAANELGYVAVSLIPTGLEAAIQWSLKHTDF